MDQAVLEPESEVASQPSNPPHEGQNAVKPAIQVHRKRTTWTREQAAAMRKKATAAIKAKCEYRAKLDQDATALLARVQSKAEEAQEAKPAAMSSDKWSATQTSTVRARIERLLALLDTSTDPGDMARLASAVGTLEEVERRFSDRQLPPTVRSSQARRGGGAAGLMD